MLTDQQILQERSVFFRMTADSALSGSLCQGEVMRTTNDGLAIEVVEISLQAALTTPVSTAQGAADLAALAAMPGFGGVSQAEIGRRLVRFGCLLLGA